MPPATLGFRVLKGEDWRADGEDPACNHSVLLWVWVGAQWAVEGCVPASKQGMAESPNPSYPPQAGERGGVTARSVGGGGGACVRGGAAGTSPAALPVLPALGCRGAVQLQCRAGSLPRAPRRLRAVPALPPARPLRARPRPAPPRRGPSTAPRGPEPAERLPAGALNGAAGPGARDPPRRVAAPDGCRRGGRAWMRRELEASSSRRRLCPGAPYGLKVSTGRIERRETQGHGERRRELQGQRGRDQKFVPPLPAACLGAPAWGPALHGLPVGQGRRASGVRGAYPLSLLLSSLLAT